MNQRFDGKVALVTGAASGIGLAVLTRLAQEGARVVGVDRNLRKVDDAVRAVAGDNGIALSCDVSDESAISDTVAAAVARFGGINVLVNSAGIVNRERWKLHEVPVAEWDAIQNVNARGTFLMMRSVIPHMLAQGSGAIVNIGSIGSFRATVTSSAYATSKGAVLMMTRAAAVDYARDNIRTNIVCPGTIRTALLDGSTPEVLEMLEARAPQGRLGEPEEVASLVAFLASDEARHINGGSYIIDGGRCAGG